MKASSLSARPFTNLYARGSGIVTITVDMDPGFASLAGRDCVDVLLQLGWGLTW